MDPKQAKSIFLHAVEQVLPSEWPSYLDEVCGDDARLRHGVELLLAAHKENVDLAEQARQACDSALPTLAQPIAERPGTQIGPYKLLQEIGQGGMGVVFMAEQLEPVKRRVALKIIKPGMDTRQVIARFEAERQALSLMDHPNIAKVLDAGTTETSRPYFVMELVKGQPITQYCDEHHLTPRQRLELLLPVCQAIQHAHQKGIIHRDVKPSNVLVAEYDGRPVPKVIDFGVAKAISQPLTEKTMFTGFGQIVGTLEYMSPEQASVNQLDIDTRSDIYSLGVLLYELLTGTTPFDPRRLRSAAWDEILRIIREEEPPRPSTRLSDLSGGGASRGGASRRPEHGQQELPVTTSLASVAAQRQTDPAKLSRLVRGELDWIVMRALEKDRARRYETANAFAEDLERYLHDEPVQACPPSAAYRLRKFVRRHQGPVVATSLLLLALICGLIGTAWGLFQVRQERDRTRQAYEEVARKEREASEAAVRERDARRGAESVADLLESAFNETNPRADWKHSAELNLRLRDRLRAAAGRLDTDFGGDELARARLQTALGHALLLLGEGETGLPLLDASLRLRASQLGPGHPDTLDTRLKLARAHLQRGHYEQAVTLLKTNLDLANLQLPPDSLQILTNMSDLAETYRTAKQFESALSLYQEVLERQKRVLGPDHVDTLASVNGLGLTYLDQGQFRRAIPLLEQLLAQQTQLLGAEHYDTLVTANNLGLSQVEAGEFDEAVKILSATLERQKSKLSLQHPATLSTAGNLALAYKGLKRFADALPLLELCAEKQRELFGAEHPQTLLAANNLAGVYAVVGRHHDAIRVFEQILPVAEKVFGPNEVRTLTSMNNLASAYRSARQFDKAVPLQERALAAQREILGPDHAETLVSLNNLGLLFRDLDQYDRAIELLQQAYDGRAVVFGSAHPATLTTALNLANALEAARKFEPAIQLVNDVWQQRRRKLGAQNPQTVTAQINLVETYFASGNAVQATTVARECLQLLRDKDDSRGVLTAAILTTLGKILVAQGQADEAEPLLREALAMRQKLHPDDWVMFNTQSVLGAALASRKQLPEAEQSLLDGFSGLQNRRDDIPVHLHRKTLDAAALRLVEFYDAMGQPEKAATWRQTLELLKDPPPAVVPK